MTAISQRQHGDEAQELAEQLVVDIVEQAVNVDRIEVQYVTTDQYQLIVQARGEEPRDPIVVP